MIEKCTPKALFLHPQKNIPGTNSVKKMLIGEILTKDTNYILILNLSGQGIAHLVIQ